MSGQNKEFKFNVIAGRLKGRIIRAPDLGITRPPLSRLRRSIFDYLNPILPGARYLDLFSGTGSYMFEAISRGTVSALGVEREPRLAAAINRQAAQLQIADQLQCLSEDVFTAIPRLHRSGREFDIIMIAPPQYQGLIDRTLACLVEHPLARTGATILCQHDTSEACPSPAAYPLVESRKYGNTTYSIMRR
ncbi:MAG: RsmD family RNA methyltransferase [bacterium]